MQTRFKRFIGLGGVVVLGGPVAHDLCGSRVGSGSARSLRHHQHHRDTPAPLNPGGRASATAPDGDTITLTGSGHFVAPANGGGCVRRERRRHLDDNERRQRHLCGHGARQLAVRQLPDRRRLRRQHRRGHADQRHGSPRDRLLGRERGRPDRRLPRTGRAARNLRGHRHDENRARARSAGVSSRARAHTRIGRSEGSPSMFVGRVCSREGRHKPSADHPSRCQPGQQHEWLAKRRQRRARRPLPQGLGPEADPVRLGYSFAGNERA
jgi:hypothetical protein